MAEKNIEQAVVEWAEKRGWYVRKLTSPGKRGAFDRIFFRRGVTALIELKQPGGTLSHHQTTELSRLREQKIPCLVAYSTDEAKRFLKALES